MIVKICYLKSQEKGTKLFNKLKGKPLQFVYCKKKQFEKCININIRTENVLFFETIFCNFFLSCI